VQVNQMSIGEFARHSRLSPKALRLYDELGLLKPAQVDDDSGYRYYSAAQLDRARLIAALRELQIPLAEIKSIVDLEPDAAAERITEHWNATEARHTARRDLARYLIDRMQGKRPAMYEVTTREIPARSVLCVKRSVEGIDGAWAFGKEFIGVLRNHNLPKIDGRTGAFYCIWWGEVNDDSDGPLEWCRPVPTDHAEQVAIQVPELVLRTEPPHQEAFIQLGQWPHVEVAQWPLITQSLLDWSQEHKVQPSHLGARMTYLADATVSQRESKGPDCDFALPIN
jgi:DNA-binding transcriptional MerR regulator